MAKEYTEKQWKEEMKASGVIINFPNNTKFSYGTTLPCPWCKTVGFYGPRIDSDSHKYRACKFCGIWQEVQGAGRNIAGGQPYRCKHVYCEKCRTLDTYNWHSPDSGLDNCRRCGAEEKETNRPPDNPDHPFHKIKEAINRAHNSKDT